MIDFIKINEIDNVAVAIKEGVTIPLGHKKALKNILKGEQIIKYGNPIGTAISPIHEGEWVHTHNLKTNLETTLDYTYHPIESPMKIQKGSTFKGYRRKDGTVGIRNEIWIIPTVGCVNDIARIVMQKARQVFGNQIDSINCFTHPYGCSQLGIDHQNTRTLLTRLVQHPNAGGVLVIGLGCENNSLEEFEKNLGDYDPSRVGFIKCQDETNEIEASLKKIKSLVAYANTFQREAIDIKELIVGLKCGGSDGLSGITANPLVGRFSDRLISEGGSTILTEVPEMFGAETLLMNRCINEKIFLKTVDLVNNFKDYFTRHNQVIYENPSPGNKKGGISTLEDKSLGCTQKSGSAPVVDVLEYGENLKTKGLNLLQGPGNDLVATTALVASGAQLVLFTTGRGTPFGCPVPTIKVSTNTALYKYKYHWIDFNAGTLVTGEKMDELSERFYTYIIALASGKLKTKTEENDIRDIAIFKQGITL